MWTMTIYSSFVLLECFCGGLVLTVATGEAVAAGGTACHNPHWKSSAMRSTHMTFAIYWSIVIDVLGTPALATGLRAD